MCGGKVAVNLETFLKRLGCLSVTVLSGVDAAEVEARFCRARHQTDGYSQRSIRLIDPALLGKDNAKVERAPMSEGRTMHLILARGREGRSDRPEEAEEPVSVSS